MADGGWKGLLERRGDVLTAGLVAAGALTVLLSTVDDFGMAWDEGFTVEREERLREWFGRVGGGDSASRAWPPALSKLERRADYLRRAGASAASPWSRESLRFYWPFAREEPNGHPPFYALLGLAGWVASHRVLPPPGPYRVGPIVLFGLTVGVVHLVMARRAGRSAGLLAALGLLTMPRVFAHAHLASYDVPVLCLWFLATAAFLEAVEAPAGSGSGSCRPRWGWVMALGMAWGCAAATKFTGWLLPAPLIAWTVFYRDRRAGLALLVGGLVAALVVWALIPTWWADPIGGLRVFLRSNLTRGKLLPIPTVFLGRLYLFSLPWYNTVVLTAVVVPPAMLVLALIGAGRLALGRFRDRAGTLWLGSWVFFLVLRALPNAPGHDGARQFLASFVFLACVAGTGLEGLGAWLSRGVSRRAARGATGAVLAAAVAAGAWSTWRYHPLQLSYYNVLIGGLSGAARAGLEPTYYWDAVTPEVRAWLNAHTDPGRTVAFAFPAVTFEYLHHWGLLRPAVMVRSDEVPQWCVVMNRPGHLRYPPGNVVGYLFEHGLPTHVETLPFAPDVPLVTIYPGEDVLAADQLLRSSARGDPP